VYSMETNIRTSMKPNQIQRSESKSRRMKESTLQDYIAELLWMHESIMAAKRSVDSMGMDRETLIQTVKRGMSEFDGLLSAITENRKRDALAAAAHLNSLFHLVVYGTICRMEEPNETDDNEA